MRRSADTRRAIRAAAEDPIRRRRAAGGHRADAWPLRPRREPRAAARVWDVPVYAHRARDAVSDRPLRVSATRSAGRPRRHGAGVAWLSARSDRSRRPRARVTGRAPCPTSTAGAGSTRRATRRGTSRSSATRIGTLVSGDALITTKQESMSAVLVQRRELHGPPAYFTPDWDRAGDSVRAAGGARPRDYWSPGTVSRGAANGCARRWPGSSTFRRRERPRFGRYAIQPAIADEDGVGDAAAGPPARGARRGRRDRGDGRGAGCPGRRRSDAETGWSRCHT